jgi:acetyl-CoA carboxylase biotin carboxyl carrier protein
MPRRVKSEDPTLSQRKPGKKPKRSEPPAKAPRVAAGTGPMDVNLLEQIVQLMSANDLNSVDLRDGERRVVLRRGAPVVQYSNAPMMSHQPQASSPASTSQAPAAASVPAVDAAEANLIAIKSPMVGTYYAAPKQGEKPFVAVGKAVNEESDVCIIEAMKVFNVIKAETSGTIAKILIQDGEPVEHGTVMFLVKP